jgi:hypothetical protein
VKAVTTILYKPFGILFGILGGLVAKRIFDWLWSKVDDEEPPEANTEQVIWPKLLAAAALQGMVFKIVRAFVDRGTAKSFAYVTGVWPGERKPDTA